MVRNLASYGLTAFDTITQRILGASGPSSAVSDRWRPLALIVRYADHSTTTREPHPARTHRAHSPQLRSVTYALHAALGLQRARVRGITLRAKALFDAGSATRQLTFGASDDKARRIEAAADRARARFGPDAVRLPARRD